MSVPYQFQPVIQSGDPYRMQALLQQAGLWDGFTNMPANMGDRPRGQQYNTDWNRLAGYSLGGYDADGQEYYALRDPAGNIVAQHQQQNGAVTFRDLVTGGAFIGAMALGIPAAAGAAGYGGAAAAGAAGTAAPATGGAFVPAGSTGLTAAGTGGTVAGSGLSAGLGGLGGSAGGGAVAGTGINFGSGAAASLYAPTGYAAGGLGTTAAATGAGSSLGTYLSAAQLASGLYGSYQAGQSAQDAAAAQQAAAQQGITAQQQALAQLTQRLDPYTQGGPEAFKAQQDLAGVNGPQAQAAAIEALRQSPQFTSQQQLGEERILANASATGGLRGGNVQAALAQFSPALLADTINQQYSRLGGIVGVAQNSAAGVGTAGMNTANNVSNLFQQQGAAQAGGYLAQGRTQLGYAGAIANAIGTYYGIKGGF